MKKRLWIIIAAALAVIVAGTAAAVAFSSGNSDEISWQEQYDLGVRYLSSGNYQEAIIAFTAAIEIDPRNPDIYMSRAEAYMGLDDTASARADYEKALELNDTLADAWLGLAETYIKDGDLEKALEILREASEKVNDARITEKMAELEGLPHVHTWAEATCTTPKTCTECGATEGEPLNHTWVDATCTEPRTCSKCGETEGEPLGHDWQDATYDAPATCSRCGYKEGKPLEYNITWTLENSVLTINGSGPMKDYGPFPPWYGYRNEIEQVVIENGVTSIGNVAFFGCNNIVSVIIPDSVMTIGNLAFYECYGLTSIVIPDSVTTIGHDAFCRCQLKSVVIPDSVTEIGFGAFSQCSNLESIVLEGENRNYVSVDGVLFSKDMTLLHTCPAGKGVTEYIIPFGVTTIGNEAFMSCFSLKSVVIPDSVTTIGDDAFSFCSLTNITIPDNVTVIGEAAFFACGLTNVTIPANVSTIGSYAFGGLLESIVVESENQNYVSVNGVLFNKDMTLLHSFPAENNITEYVIPSSVVMIGDYAFSGCYNLTDVILPENMTSIGKLAFQSCNSLMSIVIPNGVTTIGTEAFRGCNRLTSIVIPASVTTMGDAAFELCESLTDIYYGGTEEAWAELSADVLIPETTTIHYNSTT